MMATDWGVGDEVMDIVAALPPSYRQPATKVCDEHADQGVGEHAVGNASVACVMGSEHDLMLEPVSKPLSHEGDGHYSPRINQESQLMSSTILSVG